MRFERVHIALLSVMSIFTGVIAPTILIDNRPIPLPMTNARELSVIILFALAMMFYLAMERRWKLYHFVSAVVTILIGWIAVEYALGNMSDIRSGGLATGLGWGWMFLGVGVLGFFLQGRESFRSLERDKGSIFDHIIAVIGSLILLGLSGIIIFISLYGESHKSETSVLSMYYGSGGIVTESGLSLSPAYKSAPEYLKYDRKSDILSFVIESQSGKVLEHSSGDFSLASYDTIHPVYINYGENIAIAKKSDRLFLVSGKQEYPISRALYAENSVLTKSASGWQLS